jgi:trigger factor
VKPLKIELQAQEDHQSKVIAEFPAGELERYKHQAARQIANKAKIPGFRPGKAPYDVILRLYGDAAIEEEAIELMVEDQYPKILDEAKIQPAAPGSLEKIDKGDPIKFTFTIPLEPTVDLGDYKSLRKKYSVKSVAEKEIDQFIDRLKKSYATAETVDRAAKESDMVYVKLDAHLTNPGPDDKAELLKDSPLQVVVGESDPEVVDFPYAGFGENLKGLKAGDEKTVKYTYPEDSNYDKLRGKEVEFLAKVESVKSMTLPELDDAFAQTVGEFENVARLREAIKEQLQNRATAEYDQGYFDELIEMLIKKATIKYPPQVLEHEMEHVEEHVKEDLAQQRMELETYLKTLNKEKDAWLEEEIKPAARKRLERSLVLDKLAKEEKVEIKNEDLQSEYTQIISEMQGSTDIKKLQKQLKNERVANALAMEAATRVLNRQVLNRLKDIATGKLEEKPAKESPAATETAEKPAAKASKAKKPAAEAPAETEAAAPAKTKKPAAKKAEKTEDK